MYGHNSGDVYVVLVPYKSLAEVDAGFANARKFADQMGESGIKKIAQMSASSTESIESNLLLFNPKISYPADEWVKADPGFWKPKPAALAIASEGAGSIGPQPIARPKFPLNAAQLGTATYGSPSASLSGKSRDNSDDHPAGPSCRPLHYPLIQLGLVFHLNHPSARLLLM